MKRDSQFLYSTLANNLRQQILSGYIKPGEFLLSEFELAKHYGLSRISVRKSLEILSAEGLVIKKAGQGTMVPHDFQINTESGKTLNIITTSPSIFSENCLPLIIDEYKKKHPNIAVRVINIPIVMFWQSVREFEESGLHPDLLLVTPSDISNMEYGGTFLNLNEAIQDKKDQFYSKLVTSGNPSISAVEAMPVTFSTVFLAYNPILFNRQKVTEPEKDWTRDEFIETAQRLTIDTNGDGITDQYGFSFAPILTRWPIFALQNCGAFKLANGNYDTLYNTLDFIHTLLFRNRVAVLHPRWSSNPSPFFTGKSAMTLTSSLELANMKNNQISFSPKVAPMPFGENESTMLITNSFMIPSTTSSSELAFSFLRLALSTEVQSSICRDFRFLSVFKHVNEKQLSKNEMHLYNITDNELKNSYFLQELFPEAAIVSELEAAMEPFWMGLESAEATAKKIFCIGDGSLAKNC